MPKIIFSDLDGTLLHNDKTISKSTISSIHELIKEDNYFVVNTGRPFYRVSDILKELDIVSDKQYVCCFNGGLITSTDHKTILYENKLKDEEAYELIKLAEKVSINVLAYFEDIILADGIPSDVSYLNSLSCCKVIEGGKASLLEKHGFYKIIYVGTAEEIARVRKIVYNDLIEKYMVVQSDDYFLEICPKNNSKGNAIKILSSYLNIKLSDIYAIGDEENDLAMIIEAGIGCAVANAKKIIKDKAKLVFSSNENDGVEELIKKQILKSAKNEKILVSACLLGDMCKYNGSSNSFIPLKEFLTDYEIIKICPECDSGLKIPRKPAEIINGKVINIDGEDVTSYYKKGAEIALKKALDNNVKKAILKENSPSCGSGFVYDGTFSHKKVLGDGLTAKLLKENGIKVYNENNFLEINK